MKNRTYSDVEHFQALSINAWKVDKNRWDEFKRSISSRSKELDRKVLDNYIEAISNDKLPNVHRTNGRRVFNPFTAMSHVQRGMFTDSAGDSLVEIDCANSQPFHLVHSMINQGFKVEKGLVKLVKDGDFYSIFKTKDSTKSRDEIKESVFSFFYELHINEDHDVYKRLTKLYPDFMQSFKIYAEGKSLAGYMQEMESNVWIDKVSTALMVMDIPHLTVHDSAVFSKRYASQVWSVINQSYEGVLPRFTCADLATETEFEFDITPMNLKDVWNDVNIYHNRFWELKHNRAGFYNEYDIPDMVRFMASEGIAKFFTTDIAYLIIMKSNSRIREIGSDVINKLMVGVVEKYGLPDVDLKINALLETLKPSVLSLLPDFDDSSVYYGEKDKLHLFYQDIIVEVTSGQYEYIKYERFNKIIWEKHILKRDAPSFHHKDKGDFQLFFENVIDPDQRDYAKRVFGYALHPYRNIAELKAVVFNDENTDDSSRGGTGKGIMRQALSQFLSFIIENGKAFKTNEVFSFQNLNYDTRMLVIDDIYQKFNIESLFSIITEGVMVQKKYQQPFYLTPERSPMVVLTTNYGVQGSDDSHKRRRLDLMLKKHYTASFTPKDEFGKLLFIDWGNEEWDRFDSFMVGCAMLYLSKGLTTYVNPIMKEKQFNADTSDGFLDFMDTHFDCSDKSVAVDLDGWQTVDKNDLLEKWIVRSKMVKTSKAQFTRWVKKYSAYKRGQFKSDRIKDTYAIEIGQTSEREESNTESDGMPDF